MAEIVIEHDAKKELTKRLSKCIFDLAEDRFVSVAAGLKDCEHLLSECR